MKAIPKAYYAPLLITVILLVGQLSYGLLESYTKTLMAIVSSIATELILGRLLTGKWPRWASAYVTGISIGILVRSPFYWPYLLDSATSITSKYALRYRGRHLWNPSNFGICLLLLTGWQSASVLSQQWGNSLAPMVVIWILGSFILWQVKRFHISATYVLAFLVFAIGRSAITGLPWLATIGPITGPMYQLFIFFMITDPKTTVKSVRGQCTVAVMVALVEALLRLGEILYAPFYALTLVGPVALFIEARWFSNHEFQPLDSN